jgi:hypothetical protein
MLLNPFLNPRLSLLGKHRVFTAEIHGKLFLARERLSASNPRMNEGITLRKRGILEHFRGNVISRGLSFDNQNKGEKHE